MIKFNFKNKETGKKEFYEKEYISLEEAERFYDLQENVEKEQEKARKKAVDEVEKEHGKGEEFDNPEFYIQLVQNKYNQYADGKKIRKMERDYFVSLFADQSLSEDDILKNMSTKQYNKLSEEIFREISGEVEEDTKDESEEVGKSEEQ